MKVGKMGEKEGNPSDVGRPTSGGPFAKGQLVRPRDDPSVKGAVVSVGEAADEPIYTVLLDGDLVPFYQSQLIAADVDGDKFSAISISQLRPLLTATQVLHPSTKNLHSLNAARIDFVPYQYQPVLKLVRADQPRLLVADSVGVGKTIEAGLILRELQARQEVRRVMVICPRPLVTEQKWRNELRRFDEDFVHLDGRTMRYCLEETDNDGVWPAQYDRVIVPFSLLTEDVVYGSKRRPGLMRLDPPPHFDVLIVDEAHYIKNPETLRCAAVRFLSQSSDAVVFLTATPVQLGEQDLFTLLNALRPDVFIDYASFSAITRPNEFINRAAQLAREGEDGWVSAARQELEHAAETGWGRRVLQLDPTFQRVVDSLTVEAVSRERRVREIRNIEALHTLGRFMTRTLRRDIGDFTTRKSHTISVEFSEQQRLLHDAILDLHEHHYREQHGDQSVAFFLSMIRRQVASSVAGLAPMLEDLMQRRFSDVDWMAASDSEATVDVSECSGLVAQVLALAAEFVEEPAEDPKLQALLGILEDKRSMANNRVMVFSSFRHTLAYLKKAIHEAGLRVGVIHGGVPDDDRVKVRSRFVSERDSDDAIDVLLFSEVGSEGLDYQFCDCIVNYDLPWNPMRVDQRIGRIDRRGQTSEAVAIYNLITQGTIDAEIYLRCLVRIGVFERALGANEVILGDITRDIRNVAEDLNLSEAERNAKLEQVADNAIRESQEQERLEAEQGALFGLQLPKERFGLDVADASSSWLSPKAVRGLVSLYTQQLAGTDSSPIQDGRGGTTLRLSKEARGELGRAGSQLTTHGPMARRWSTWLDSEDPSVPVAFDSEEARSKPESVLLGVVHPLVRLAAKNQLTAVEGRPFCGVTIGASHLSPGDYPFCIYHWDYRGIVTDSRLVPVVDDNHVAVELLGLLEHADGMDMRAADVDPGSWERLEQVHHQQWVDARAGYADEVAVLADFRKSSLTTSHNARLDVLARQIARANSELITTMKRGERNRLEVDFRQRMATIEQAIERADIRAAPIAFGVIRVTSDS